MSHHTIRMSLRLTCSQQGDREEDHRQIEVRIIPGALPGLPVIDVSLKVRELQKVKYAAVCAKHI